nr:hypothetical protein [Paludibacterium denitrificans]
MTILAAKLLSQLVGHVQLAADVLQAELSAVLFDGTDADAQAARATLAARDGALVPLVLKGQSGYNLHRLVVERAVSVNTTAAGGNASLMSIGD